MSQPIAGSAPLLGPRDPAPVLAHGEDRHSPFIILCDHAGKAIPESLGNLGLTDGLLSDHIGWDINAWAVSVALAERLGAPAFGQAFSRLVIDCNRRLSAKDSIASVSAGVPVPGNQALSQNEVELRYQSIMAPYQNRIAEHLSGPTGGALPCIVSMHTFTPRFHLGPERPWHVGVISGPDERMRRAVLEYLLRHASEFVIGDNAPYQVGMETDYTLPVHAEAAGLPYVEFELRNDRFHDAQERQRLCCLLAEALIHAYERLPIISGETV